MLECKGADAGPVRIAGRTARHAAGLVGRLPNKKAGPKAGFL